MTRKETANRVFTYWQEYYKKYNEWPSQSRAAIDLNYADSTGVRRQLKKLQKEGLIKQAKAHYWYIRKYD